MGNDMGKQNQIDSDLQRKSDKELGDILVVKESYHITQKFMPSENDLDLQDQQRKEVSEELCQSRDQDFFYEIVNTDFVKNQFNNDYNKFLEAIDELDHQSFEGLLEEEEFLVAEASKIFKESPKTWRLLTYGKNIVGYWIFISLPDDIHEKFANREMMDSELNSSMLVETSLPGEYNCYFIAIIIHPDHQNYSAFQKLIKSMYQVFKIFADEGKYFKKISAISFGKQGENFCRKIGMSQSDLKKYPGKKKFEIVGTKMHETYLGKKSGIDDKYKKHFIDRRD